MAAGRDYYGLIDPAKPYDDTKRRALFAATSSTIFALFFFSPWMFLLFPFFWLFQILANDVSLCAIHGRGASHVEAMADGNQFIPNLVRKIWPDEKLDINSKMQVKLRSTLYEAICDATLIPIIAAPAIVAGNWLGLLVCLAFPIPALSYMIAGLGAESKAGPRAEFLTGSSLAFLCWQASNFIPMFYI